MPVQLFGYSVYALFLMAEAQRLMDEAKVVATCMSFYFESAAMILTLITVGKMLEARSRGKTTDAIKDLMKLAPQTAVVVRDGKGNFRAGKKRFKKERFSLSNRGKYPRGWRDFRRKQCSQ